METPKDTREDMRAAGDQPKCEGCEHFNCSGYAYWCRKDGCTCNRGGNPMQAGCYEPKGNANLPEDDANETNPPPIDSPAGQICGAAHCSTLLEWLGDNAAELVAEDYPIADTGDWSTIWAVYEDTIDGVKSRSLRIALGMGDSPQSAIEDAMKDENDPSKFDYVPPEFR